LIEVTPDGSTNEYVPGVVAVSTAGGTVTTADGVDAGPVPTALMAATSNSYPDPGLRPVAV
jgi:hypothetical protein